MRLVHARRVTRVIAARILRAKRESRYGTAVCSINMQRPGVAPLTAIILADRGVGITLKTSVETCRWVQARCHRLRNVSPWREDGWIETASSGEVYRARRLSSKPIRRGIYSGEFCRLILMDFSMEVLPWYFETRVQKNRNTRFVRSNEISVCSVNDLCSLLNWKIHCRHTVFQ